MMPAPRTMLEWATANCTAMKPPEEIPDTEVSRSSMLSVGRGSVAAAAASRTAASRTTSSQAPAPRRRAAWHRELITVGRRDAARRGSLLFLVARPEFRRQLALGRRRDLGIVAEFDAVGAAPAGQRLEPRLVVGQLGQRHLGRDRRHAAAAVGGAGDLAALARQVAGQVADRRLGTEHLDIDDRLQDDRRRGADGFHHRFPPGGDEGHLLAIDRMRLAVIDDDAQVDDREARYDTFIESAAHALLHGRHEDAGNGAALDLVGELEAGAARQRLDAQEHLAELAGAAALLLVA